MQTNQRQRRGINPWWMIWPAAAGLLVLLFSGHREHVLDYLPFLVLLACPLMHMFMHGRHGHGSHHSAAEAADGPGDEQRAFREQ